MIVESCTFVVGSKVFQDCDLASDIFCNSNPDCTWGDCDRSLITGDVIRNKLLDEVDIEDDKLTEEQQQVRTVCERLDLLLELGDIYIDLEN